MGKSYPDRTNARGIWKLSDITKNKITDGTYPGSQDLSGTIGLFAGGKNPSNINTVDQISIPTTGNTSDYGDLLQAQDGRAAGVGSSTRGIHGGGRTPTKLNVIQYTHFKSGGNFADFGDLTAARDQLSSHSNNTRGLFAGGLAPGKSNIIDFITVTSLGNATDFGNLTTASYSGGGTGNHTRAILQSGGLYPSTTDGDIDFVEIASTGNGADFGDLSSARYLSAGMSTSTKGFFGGGYYYHSSNAAYHATVDEMNIGSKSGGTDYGDLTVARSHGKGASSSTRGVVGGGHPGSSPNISNVMDFISLKSAGNATDFGDLSSARTVASGMSNGHGGILESFPRAPELYSPTGRPFPDGGGGIGDLGLFAGGEYNYSNVVDFITISTTGNASDFGNLDGTRSAHAGAGSKIRGFTGGGQPGLSNVITYKDFRSKGNFADFGDLTGVRDKLGSLNNDTRAVWGGGRTETSSNTNSNVMDYITMASIGNATDFGNLSVARKGIQGASSTTRGVFGGGYTPSFVNTMDYITIANTGDASDFGDLSVARAPIGGTGAASSTRATFACGQKSSNSNVIDYITIANTGNATDFGDMEIVSPYATGVSNSVRGVFAGFNNTGAAGADGDFGNCPHISYITIASTGNYTDFGDLSLRRYGISGISNGHGGLS